MALPKGGERLSTLTPPQRGHRSIPCCLLLASQMWQQGDPPPMPILPPTRKGGSPLQLSCHFPFKEKKCFHGKS